MQNLFHSTLLNALGYAIAHSFWQMGLIWFLYKGITSIFTLSSSTKYRLSIALQFIGFIWFLFTFQFYYQQYENVWNMARSFTLSQNIQNGVSLNNGSNSLLINWMIKGEQFLPFVSIAYFILLTLLCFRWVVGYQQTQHIRNIGIEKINVSWRLFVSKIAERLSISKEISIYVSTKITSPLTIGFFKPVILIPIASINYLSIEQLEAVLLHEMAHIKRADYGVNLLISIVEICLFFNPFIQLLSKHICKERENSCDDWVLQFQYNPSAYAEALWQIACLHSSTTFALSVCGSGKTELLERVKRLINKKETCFSYRKQILSFAILTITLFSIAWMNPLVFRNNNASNGIAKKNLISTNKAAFGIEPMAVSIENPFFNPVFFLTKPLQAEMKKGITSAQKEMDAFLQSHSNEPSQLIESLTPIIANTFTEAAIELDKSKQALLTIDNPSSNKESMDQDYRLQNGEVLSVPQLNNRNTIEIKNSIDKMESEMNKAKKEIEKINRVSFEKLMDKVRIEKNIQEALASSKQINTGTIANLVMEAMQIPEQLFKEKNNSKLKTNNTIVVPPLQKIEVNEAINSPEENNNVNDEIANDITRNEALANSIFFVEKSIIEKLRNVAKTNKVILAKNRERIISKIDIANLLLDQLVNNENLKRKLDRATLLQLQKIAINLLIENKINSKQLIQIENRSETYPLIIQFQ